MTVVQRASSLLLDKPLNALDLNDQYHAMDLVDKREKQ